MRVKGANRVSVKVFKIEPHTDYVTRTWPTRYHGFILFTTFLITFVRRAYSGWVFAIFKVPAEGASHVRVRGVASSTRIGVKWQRHGDTHPSAGERRGKKKKKKKIGD